MCDERERLLDYLYDGVDVEERRRVDEHLAGCEACREELSGLRAVRLDLLSWDVPEHDSVWKPFAPRRVNSWWREVPSWALAAAASLTFLLGLGGGLVARVVAPAASVVQNPPPAVTPALQPAPTLTAAQTAALEQRVLTGVLARLEAQPVSAHAQPASLVLTPLMRQQLDGQMRALIVESETRQRQALTNAVGRIWQDSDRQLQQFVKRAQFDNFRNRELPANVNYAVSQALMQQGGRQ